MELITLMQIRLSTSMCGVWHYTCDFFVSYNVAVLQVLQRKCLRVQLLETDKRHPSNHSCFYTWCSQSVHGQLYTVKPEFTNELLPPTI